MKIIKRIKRALAGFLMDELMVYMPAGEVKIIEANKLDTTIYRDVKVVSKRLFKAYEDRIKEDTLREFSFKVFKEAATVRVEDALCYEHNMEDPLRIISMIEVVNRK